MNFHKKRNFDRFPIKNSVDIQFDDGIFIYYYYSIANPADWHKKNCRWEKNEIIFVYERDKTSII